jgi:hypothetical protein
MKKLGIGMFCVVLCLAVAFLFPNSGGSWPTVDQGGCLDCHGDNPYPDGTIHTIHDGQDCETCHLIIGDTPASSACIVCHPMSDPGKCPLVNFHDPDKGGTCLDCHSTECAPEETTTTTTTEEETTTTTTTEEETTTTTTSIGDASITVTPLLGDSLRRSRWSPLPGTLVIRGEGTDFAMFLQTDVVYSPDGQVLSIFPLVLTKTLILDPIIVWPVFLAGGSEDVTLTVTVDGLSDDVEIEMLPFILDKK